MSTETEMVKMTWTATCPPGTVWIQRPPIGLMALVLLAMFSASVGLAILLQVVFSGYAAPVELSEAERASPGLVVYTVPTAMTLRILSPEDFARKRPPNATAWASYGEAGCTIYIQSDWAIGLYPRSGEAWFVTPANANTLAHEIAHCVRGDWHR